jgi:lipopolysaccharide biosynthesis glycosyltransferase
MQAGVAIASLLESAKGLCHYDIYCVVPGTIDAAKRELLKGMAAKLDGKSRISFIPAPDEFDGVYPGRWSAAAFWRLMLHRLLPNVDKIIYTDVDVMFNAPLAELLDKDISGYYVMGNRDPFDFREKRGFYKDEINRLRSEKLYTCSGILVMNLRKMRADGVEAKYAPLMKHEFTYFDQDVINLAFKDKISYFGDEWHATPLRYDRGFKIMHFMWMKPWSFSLDGSALGLADMWWKYACDTPFLKPLMDGYASYSKRTRLPKWLVRLACLLVPSRKARRSIRKKYL